MFLYFPVEQLLFSPSLGCYRSFGLAAVLDAPQGKRCLALVQDVSTQESFVAGLARRCTEEQLIYASEGGRQPFSKGCT